VGVEIQGKIVPGLFYADDIALVSSSSDDMLTMLQTVQQFFSERKLELNYKKTQILKYGPGSKEELVWSLCDDAGRELGEIRETTKYKYLGVTFGRPGRFCQHEAGKRAKGPNLVSAVKRTAGQVTHTGETANLLWKKKYMVGLLHGVEGIYTTQQFRQALNVTQNDIGRWILRVSSRAHIVGIRAELQWLSIQMEITKKLALFWGRLVTKPPQSWPALALRAQLQATKPSKWMAAMLEALHIVGSSYPETPGKWKAQVRRAVKRFAEKADRVEMGSKPSMRFYPGQPLKTECCGVRTNAGKFATQCRIGDEGLDWLHKQERCHKCGQKVTNAFVHVINQCTKQPSEKRTARIQRALRFTSYKQIKGLHKKYLKWASNLHDVE